MDNQKDNPTDRIKREVAQRRWMSVEEATAIRVEWGMNTRYVLQWLDGQIGITGEGDFPLTSNPNMADRAYAALRRLGQPATLPEIARLLSHEETTAKLQNCMSRQGRFSKCARDKYALKEWELPRYESMAKAIRQALTEHGGTMPLRQLQEVLADRFEVPPERTAGWADQIPGVLLSHGQVSLATGPTGAAPKIRLPVGEGLFRISDRQAAVVTLVTAKYLLAQSQGSAKR